MIPRCCKASGNFPFVWPTGPGPAINVVLKFANHKFVYQLDLSSFLYITNGRFYKLENNTHNDVKYFQKHNLTIISHWLKPSEFASAQIWADVTSPMAQEGLETLWLSQTILTPLWHIWEKFPWCIVYLQIKCETALPLLSTIACA